MTANTIKSRAQATEEHEPDKSTDEKSDWRARAKQRAENESMRVLEQNEPKVGLSSTIHN